MGAILDLPCPSVVPSFRNLSNENFFITLFSRTVRPRRLKLGTHVVSGQMYCVYRNQAAAAYSSLYFFVFLFLELSNLKIFFTLFSGTMRPRRLKLGTHVDRGQMYHVSGIRLLLLIHPFISSFFFLSNFQTLKVFVTLFSGTARPRRLKLGTNVDSGQMCPVYRNQAAALICPFISLFFFFQFSNIKIFLHFSQEL